MDIAIKITAENYKLIETIAKKEMRSRKTILAQAIRNFAKAKRIIKE